MERVLAYPNLQDVGDDLLSCVISASAVRQGERHKGASSIYGAREHHTGPRCCKRGGTRCDIVDRAYRLLAGCISVAGLALQFWLMAHYPSSKSLVTTAIHFFSFFTIQTNMLIAACMLLPAAMPGARLSQLLSNASIRTAILAYALLTALVYFALLRNIGQDDGLERRADQILHYVAPALFFFDWLVFGAKGQVPFRAVPRFLIYPALYVGWTFVHGALTGWYPYPFVNAKRLDLWHLATNVIGLVLVAVLIPYGLVALDRLLTNVRRNRA